MMFVFLTQSIGTLNLNRCLAVGCGLPKSKSIKELSYNLWPLFQLVQHHDLVQMEVM